LRKRFDLLAVLTDLVMSTQETVTMEFAVNDMNPIVFAIARQKEEKRLRKTCTDLVCTQ
jgi:hypothetical protein